MRKLSDVPRGCVMLILSLYRKIILLLIYHFCMISPSKSSPEDRGNLVLVWYLTIKGRVFPLAGDDGLCQVPSHGTLHSHCKTVDGQSRSYRANGTEREKKTGW